MAYRLLLPCFDALAETRLEGIMDELHARPTGDAPLHWQVDNLPGDPKQIDDAQLRVSLLGVSMVEQKPSDNYFHVPRGADSWIEVRLCGGGVNRQLRLHARLIALKIAERLTLPVLETRNGVYCRTPVAFGAWCAREPHSQTIRLARVEHITEAPRSVGRMPCPPAGAAVTRVALAPLPRRGMTARLWHGLCRRRAYVVSLPAFGDTAVLRSFVAEVFHTFGRGYVVHEPQQHRIIIYGKKSRSTRQMIGYFRTRARPKQTRLLPAYDGI